MFSHLIIIFVDKFSQQILNYDVNGSVVKNQGKQEKGRHSELRVVGLIQSVTIGSAALRGKNPDHASLVRACHAIIETLRTLRKEGNVGSSQTLCPICKKGCIDCALYRGRHYNLSFCSRYRERDTKKAKLRTAFSDPATVFEDLKDALEPWHSSSSALEHPEMKIRLTDMESGTVREVAASDAEHWDWENPMIIRMVDGTQQVTSWHMMVQVCNHKYETGCEIVELYEGPRFMLLAGG